MAKKKFPKSTKKQTNRKKSQPLKRYNKIVSLLVKDYKKRNIDYNISDVRKDVSESVYPRLKNVAPSKIRLKQVKGFAREPRQDVDEQEETVKILAENIPRKYFDISLEWFEIGEESRNNGEINPILEINKLYPDIPIVIKTGNRELRLKGKIGTYQNSLLQKFVEELRVDFENESGFEFAGVPTWFDRKDKQYALWGTEDVAEDLPPEKILDFKEADERVYDLDKKGDKKPKPKKPKEEVEEIPTPKDEPTIPRTTLADKNKAKELLLEEFKLGLKSKEEYRAEVKKIENMYKKGGKI